MGRDEETHALRGFLDSGAARSTLGLVYGRRRIGKSTLLLGETEARGGFYYEAARVEAAEQLDRLGAELGDHLDVGPLALDGWDDALGRLLALGERAETPVVLDEFGYILEGDASVPSRIAAALGPGSSRRGRGQARLVLCGSAIAMMRSLTAGQSPLRGRAGVELLMRPHDFREAAGWLPDPTDVDLAARVFAVIGGVIGYATDMVDFDLPDSLDDFDRWVCDRVLAPSATLHHEATTLLAEDPDLSSRRQTLHHTILGAIANGSVTAGRISRRVGKPVSNLAAALDRLVDAGFVERCEDPLRRRRPLYALTDPYLQFHHAILDRHRAALRRRDPADAWHGLVPTFDARVRGPVFEQQLRTWVARFATESTLGGPAETIGPSVVTVDGAEHELDVVVATGEDDPSQRTVHALGEAKAGETPTSAHVRHLEHLRAAIGTRAAGAKLLLCAPAFAEDVHREASERADLELIDLDRLYHGD